MSHQSSLAEAPTKPVARVGAEWLDLLNTGYRMVRAGLRQEIGPTGDLDAAYRRWYQDQMREHDNVLRRICERLRTTESERRHAS